MTRKLTEALSEAYRELESSQEELPPEVQKMVDDNFWDLLGKGDGVKSQEMGVKDEPSCDLWSQ